MLTTPSQAVRETWIDPFCGGIEIRAIPGFRLAIEVETEADMPVQILVRDTEVSVLLSPETAELPGVKEASSEAELRAALQAGKIRMNGPDHLFFLPETVKAELQSTANASHVRRLSDTDQAAFNTFLETAPDADADEAYVRLDHWAVFAAFDGERIIAAGSAYPFDGNTLLADCGVLTLPAHRGQGHARAVIHALARHAIAEGYEPQYRCQLDNDPSVVLARRSGFLSIGTWDVPLPEGDEA